MNFHHIIHIWLDGYRRIADFEGRARRYDFGIFMLVQAVIFLIAAFAVLEMSGAAGNLLLITPLLAWLMLSSLAYNVRRLHDTGLPGWICIFYLGFYIFTVIFSIFMRPEYGDNKYGPDPRGHNAMPGMPTVA